MTEDNLPVPHRGEHPANTVVPAGSEYRRGTRLYNVDKPLEWIDSTISCDLNVWR